jgi:hypothetical protein
MKRNGYSVMYEYNGYELYAGNPIVFPERKLAEKYMKYYQSKPWFHHELYIKTEIYEGKDLEPCREYNGKRVYNESWLPDLNCLEIGDLVEGKIVDDLMNALPPACMRSDCCQLGEPHDSRIDENGKGHNTYETFKRIADGIWEYCGDCFRGENVQRGTEMPYVL